MNVRAFVRSVTVTSITPVTGDRGGAANYDVLFEVELGENRSNLKVPASTTEGYTAAVILACKTLQEGLAALVKEVEKQETGPHPIILFTSEASSPE